MKKEEFDNKKKLVYDFVTDKEYKPMSVKEMAMVLQVPQKRKTCAAWSRHCARKARSISVSVEKCGHWPTICLPVALWQHRKGLDLFVLREKRRTISSRRIR